MSDKAFKFLLFTISLIVIIMILSGCMSSVSTYSVSGYVTYNGSGLSGVTISFSDGLPSVTTNTSGYWSQSGLTGSVVVTPSLSGYTFSPSSITVTSANNNVDFIASPISVIVGATVLQGSTQLELPKGCELYVYGMTTGGAFQSNPFVNGKTISVTNIDGLISAEMSVSTSNINEFTTDTSGYAIGGFSINDVEYIEGFYGANQGPGQGSGPGVETASVNFTLSTSATVIVIAMASSQQSITFSGINNLYIDVPSPNTGGTVAISIAHAYLGTGTYTIQENSSATVGGQDPNHQADLIGVLICSNEPSAASSGNPEIPIPNFSNAVSGDRF